MEISFIYPSWYSIKRRHLERLFHPPTYHQTYPLPAPVSVLLLPSVNICLEHVFQRLNEAPHSNPKPRLPSHLPKNINLANLSFLLHQKFPVPGFPVITCWSFVYLLEIKTKNPSLTVDFPSALTPILMFPHMAHLLRVGCPESLYHCLISPSLLYIYIYTHTHTHTLIQAFEPITPIKPHFPKSPRSFRFAKSSWQVSALLFDPTMACDGCSLPPP